MPRALIACHPANDDKERKRQSGPIRQLEAIAAVSNEYLATIIVATAAATEKAHVVTGADEGVGIAAAGARAAVASAAELAASPRRKRRQRRECDLFAVIKLVHAHGARSRSRVGNQ